ncbi:MAG: Gluconeogenesis factor [Synergistetes bacterium ADurb.Bin155]|nr:YvcK family protein [Synergistales bacterium]MBP8995188.1 YvcK family protein [Synergistales bacterium]OQB46006.1 MAG: Gluconeogenesis factor [Synergistetes bacterium ADurb.Bin155]
MNWWSAFTIGFLTGGIIALLGARLFQEEVEEGAGESQDKKNGSVMTKAFLHKVSQGPEIVAIGGGTGLSTLLSGLKYYTRNITAIVTVTDEGGSSGRLRGEWGVLPPGDIRNCMLALAEDDSSLNRLLNYRFDRGELKGHSMGNLILLAATEMTGDFRKAVEELNRLLAIRGKVIPVTNESVVLCAATADGDLLRGELDIASRGSRIESIWIEPDDARAFPEALAAIENADAVVLGPGSLFTSIIPNLMFREVSEALKRTAAPKIYITNLMTQPGETDGMTLMDHIRWITRASGTIPDYILVNDEEVPSTLLATYRAAGASPLSLNEENERTLSLMGSKLILSGFLDVAGGNVRHNSQKVSETLMRIAREERDSSRWKS